MPYVSIVEVGTVNNTFIDKKCRHEFYQKPEEVVVTIFAKGIPANNVSVDFGEQIVRHDLLSYVFICLSPRFYNC